MGAAISVQFGFIRFSTCANLIARKGPGTRRRTAQGTLSGRSPDSRRALSLNWDGAGKLPYRPAGVDKKRQDPTSRRADSPSREGGGGPAYRPAALDSKRPGDPTSSRRADSSPKRPSPEDIRFQGCSISQMFLVCNLRETNLRMNVGANTQTVLSSILGVIRPQYPGDTVLFFLLLLVVLEVSTSQTCCVPLGAACRQIQRPDVCSAGCACTER